MVHISTGDALREQVMILALHEQVMILTKPFSLSLSLCTLTIVSDTRVLSMQCVHIP